MCDKKSIEHFKLSGWISVYAEFEEVLITFLCKENAFFQYIFNVNNNKENKTVLSLFVSLLDQNTPIKEICASFLSYSFTWSISKEGYRFWHDVSLRFKEHLKEIRFFELHNLDNNG